MTLAYTHWDKYTGEEVTEKITKGSSPQWQGFSYQDDGVVFITSENVRDGFLDLSMPKFLSFSFHEKHKNSQLQKGDVLINIVGASIGRACLFNGECKFANINQAVCLLRPNKKVIPEYLLYYFQVPKNQRQLIGVQSETARPNLSLSDFRKFKIELPPKNIQQQIIGLLREWDTAIEKTERLIAAKEERYRWLLLEMINKGCEKNGWEKVRLGEIFVEVTRKVGEQNVAPFSISAGIGFVSQKEKWGRDIAGKQLQKYIHLKKGEFAYNKGNSKKYACGCAYLLWDQKEICVPNVFICFKSIDKTTHPEFFEHYFIANNHARELRKYISSSARSDGLLNLSKTDFFKIQVPLPPIDTQKRIAEILSTARREINLHKNHLAALQKQKRGLMQKLLTGKWRVKVKGG